jgi:hypothetical protein
MDSDMTTEDSLMLVDAADAAIIGEAHRPPPPPYSDRQDVYPALRQNSMPTPISTERNLWDRELPPPPQDDSEIRSVSRRLEMEQSVLHDVLVEEQRNRREGEIKLRELQEQVNQLQSAAERDLASERLKCSQLQTELQDRDAALEDIRQRWKTAARELGKVRQSQEQGRYQVTDSYLIELASQLRYNVRSFAIQHFSGEIKSKLEIEMTRFYRYIQETTESYQAYLTSPEHMHYIIQAFLWRVLRYEVFESFWWVRGRTSLAAKHLCDQLEPGEYIYT